MRAIFDQMVRFQFAMASYLFEMLGTTAKGLGATAKGLGSTAKGFERITLQNFGIDPAAGREALPGPMSDLAPATGTMALAAPSSATPPAPQHLAERPVAVPPARASEVFRTPTQQANCHEERTAMVDKNLNDNNVKLVEYTVVTIERERERLLEGPKQVIVTDDLTGDAFSNARVAAWFKETGGKVPNGDGKKRDLDLDTLRVYYRVLDRWPKEDLKFDENTLRYDQEKVEVLREIRDKMPK